jgi:serine/threonine-protein phosphatase 6 regulatory subunit 3
MFWQYNTLSTSQFETIFEKEDVTLSEILDQENVIQECKTQTKKLIDFLTKPEILSELISLITTEPPPDVDEISRFKLPHVASEILMCEVPQISSAISQDEVLLEKLFTFMESESPLNPLLASFFTKAVGNILTRKSEQNWYDHQFICVQIVDFLKKKEFVKSSLQHRGTSAITELVLRLITCMENGDIRTGILEWLNERELVQSIIKLIEKNEDRDTHDNAARLVIEILRVSRDSQYAPASDRFDDPLLNTLESGETVQLLLKIIFGQHVEDSSDNGEEKKKDSEDSNPAHPPHSVISNGISILLALLETRSTAVNCYNANQNQEYCAEFNSQNNSNELSSEDAAKQEATLKVL